MPDCGGCNRTLNDSWLCADCQTELREVLTELALGCRIYIGNTPTDKRGPSFLRYLEDSRLGFTRLGESERRSNENSRPALARLTSDERDSFKGSPLELCNEVHQTLTHWATVISTSTETLGRQQ